MNLGRPRVVFRIWTDVQYFLIFLNKGRWLRGIRLIRFSFRSGTAENWLLLTVLLRVYVHQPGLWLKVTESELSSVTHRHCGLHNRRSKLTRNISSFWLDAKDKEGNHLKVSDPQMPLSWIAHAVLTMALIISLVSLFYNPTFLSTSLRYLSEELLLIGSSKNISVVLSIRHLSLDLGPLWAGWTTFPSLFCWLLKSNFKRTLSDVSNIFLNIKMLFIRQEINVRISATKNTAEAKPDPFNVFYKINCRWTISSASRSWLVLLTYIYDNSPNR